MPRNRYYQKYPEKYRLQLREYYKKLRLMALDMLGNKCNTCGFDDPRALQIDHINGGGTKHRKETTKTFIKSVVDSLLDNEGIYQLLCANCNWIKRVENKEDKSIK